MPRPYYSVVIPGPVEKVWEIVRDFGHLSDWHPATQGSALVRGCSGGEVSAQRTFTLVDGGAHVREQMVALDDRSRTVVFAVVDGPFPVRNYVATIRLTPISESGQTFGEWWAEFDADLAASDKISQSVKDTFFVAGLGALQKRFS